MEGDQNICEVERQPAPLPGGEEDVMTNPVRSTHLGDHRGKVPHCTPVKAVRPPLLIHTARR